MRGNYSIHIQIEKEFRGMAQRSFLRRVAEKALRAEGVDSVAEVGLVVAGDDRVRELNHRYRGQDSATDVLAFSLEEGEFVPPADGIRRLGEVIISCPQAQRQALEQGHSLLQELALLVVHGILHLLGYDDEEPELEPKMREREAEILKGL